jgi:hypothetical protein
MKSLRTVALLALLAGCSSTSSSSVTDSGQEAGADGSLPPAEAAPEASDDATTEGASDSSVTPAPDVELSESASMDVSESGLPDQTTLPEAGAPDVAGDSPGDVAADTPADTTSDSRGDVAADSPVEALADSQVASAPDGPSDAPLDVRTEAPADTGSDSQDAADSASQTCATVCPAGTQLCNNVCVSSSDPTYVRSDGTCQLYPPVTPSPNCVNCPYRCETYWPTCPCPATCACPVGQTACAPSVCIDETSDPANCGACGNVCGAGTACIASKCQAITPYQMVTGFKAPTDIAIDALHLYVTDSDPTSNTVWQIEKTTFAKTALATGEGKPWRVAVDGAYVYWTSNTAGAVRRTPIGSASAATLYAATAPLGLAVDGSNVYWSDSAGIHDAPKGGGGTVALLAGPPGGAQLAQDPLPQDATNLYYWIRGYSGMGPNQLLAIDKVTNAISTVESNPVGADGAFVSGIASNGTDISYFYNIPAHQYAMYRQPLATGATLLVDPIDVSSAFSALVGYAVADGCWTYWSYNGALMKAVVGATAPEVLFRGGTGPGELAVDDQYVYWVDSAGFVGRIGK